MAVARIAMMTGLSIPMMPVRMNPVSLKTTDVRSVKTAMVMEYLITATNARKHPDLFRDARIVTGIALQIVTMPVRTFPDCRTSMVALRLKIRMAMAFRIIRMPVLL